MKIKLELNLCDQGPIFLNFWDTENGRDVCCEMIGGRLFLQKYGENGEDLPPEEISLEEFIQKIESTASQID